MSRQVFDLLKGWPEKFGAYGGGEEYFNFVGAVLGIKKFILPNSPLHHHGAKRDYRVTHSEICWNRAQSIYCYSGESALIDYIKIVGSFGMSRDQALYSVIGACRERRNWIKEMAKISIEEWEANWKKEEAKK
jgi:hypothetical protein